MFQSNYSNYYDLLYQDKDYQSEADFIETIIRKNHTGAKSILDLGCGTGKHAGLLTGKGYVLTGVDQSEEMLVKAKKLNSQIPFHQADIRDFNLNQKFDVVTSLFHVISYQTTLIDFERTIQAMKKHLNHGGIVIFDAWYGPAVFTDPPSTRVKRFDTDEFQLTRLSEPTHNLNSQIVDLDYTLFVEHKKKATIEKFTEHHTMRYYFQNEVEFILGKNDLSVVDCKEWLTNHQPGGSTFGVYWVIKYK